MPKQLALVALGLVVVLVLAAQLARAGANAPFPNDADPMWSSDARFVVFDRADANSATVHVGRVPAGHGSVAWLVSGRVRGIRPSGETVLVEHSGSTAILGPGRTQLGVLPGIAATWSPDGEHVAFVEGEELAVANAAGGDVRVVAAGLARPSWDFAGPVWSPDGRRIVLATTQGLLVAAAAGAGSRIVFSGENQSVNPSWSADDSTIAFERNAGPHWSIWLVDADGGRPRPFLAGNADFRFPQWSPVGGRLAFISDRERRPGGATRFRYALYVVTPTAGPEWKLVDDVRPDGPPRWSPTAAQIAVAAGQECGRFGVYVTRPEAGSHALRRTNICRFVGGPGDDTLRGTPWHDVIRGLGGDDLVEARDGAADSIDCGPGVDTAVVDRLDTVRHCERVHRL